MALISNETPLNELIINEPTVIPVINRFGIRLGIGDDTVATVCENKNLDCEFLLVILNTFINEGYFPEHTLRGFKAGEIIDYLTKTDRYYRQFQLPNIHRHFQLLLGAGSDTNNNLGLMYRFYQGLEHELLNLINHDLKEWFPAVIALEQGKETEIPTSELDELEKTSLQIEEKLSDLRNMFIKHLTGDYDLNLCYAVITAIFALEKDLRQNNRIRNRILLPINRELLDKKRS
ncbi:helix-turn-helix transcriptional regulator [uncultured Muribaculum sp.]|uniref:helix-turn-helix transcriptional regulator n=1 Tax=uncultured Muribaculum sp. TaxID=1918613 RepID=UPI002599EFA6|nr:helix-turn-helix transcriptional regulator [uncultured Muribaculum sp.]